MRLMSKPTNKLQTYFVVLSKTNVVYFVICAITAPNTET